MNPGNSGVSKTRAMVCELLGMKLLKEYTARELIDALSYDFDPLQGQTPPGTGTTLPGANWESTQKAKAQQRQARISCLEIAIRATAKRFLAHPLVVQQLEAIWKGTIVFHSAADNLHRVPVKVSPNQNKGYGATSGESVVLDASRGKLHPAKQRDHREPVTVIFRRSVTLYDPRDASLFKLSRLRVPRYRQILSTGSFAILLALFVAVLAEKSLSVSALEIVFWFWSAGFMLDEIVGFNEQGFSLYLMSFWNTFDIGILLIFICYYGLRIYGIIMPDVRKHTIANMAYDVLATNAVLLFPRLFSVMDHSRYFSQLLVAFRMMASDLVAVFILIMIACSGFFVAFTLSFGNTQNDTPSAVAYGLFQMIMGFTPAAWERWDKYDLLGKSVLTLFLFICHFLIVTILITVLTNSFMSIAQNANDEHQFVFAVNAISMVKSDALFSYVAPTNILAWILTPLRYCVPFRKYVKANRTAIKITHFPILFIIYAYERTFLRAEILVPSDAGEPCGRPGKVVGGEPGPAVNLFSPRPHRLREPSIATFQKDRALDEVFRRPFNATMRDTTKGRERRETSNVVKNWMQSLGPGGVASPPPEQDRSILERLENRRPIYRRSQMFRRAGTRDFTEATRSVASDPEEFMNTDPLFPDRLSSRPPKTSPVEISQQTDGDGDGDDELVTNDNDEDDALSLSRRTSTMDFGSQKNQAPKVDTKDYFTQAPAARLRTEPYASLSKSPLKRLSKESSPRLSPSKGSHTPRRHHSRQISTATILYNPLADRESPKPHSARHTPIPSASNSPPRPPLLGHRSPAKSSIKNTSANNSGTQTPLPPTSDPKLTALDTSTPSGRRTPKRAVPVRARPIMPPKSADAFQSAPDLAGLISMTRDRRQDSSLNMDLGSDLGDNKAIGGGFVGAVPSSFATQMAYATGALRRRGAGESGDEERRMGKLVLARMCAMEEQFREVLAEVRQMRAVGSASFEGSHSQGHSKSRSRARGDERELDRGRGGLAPHSGRRDKGKERERERRGEKGRRKGKVRARSQEVWVDEGLVDEGSDVAESSAALKGSSI
jgi:hypothetical protein